MLKKWAQQTFGGKGESAAKPRTSKQIAGDGAEALAAKYLKQHVPGLRIVHRNWREGRAGNGGHGEIDIIALKPTPEGTLLLFIEVRARKAGALVSGYHSVTAKKRAVLKRACTAFVKQHPGAVKGTPYLTWRLDVVDVALGASEGFKEGNGNDKGSGNHAIRYYENIPFNKQR